MKILWIVTMNNHRIDCKEVTIGWFAYVLLIGILCWQSNCTMQGTYHLLSLKNFLKMLLFNLHLVIATLLVDKLHVCSSDCACNYCCSDSCTFKLAKCLNNLVLMGSFIFNFRTMLNERSH